jgi:flagellar hook-basal body complex protein FliE
MSAINGPVLPLAAPHRPVELEAPLPAEKSDAPSGVFGAMLEKTIAETNQSINVAEGAAEAFAAGARDDIHGTMLALSKADIELRMVGAMRNKIVEAFQELWRMQI